ncbi:MAG TPA: hypothetical protein DCK79_06870 [Candidatus Atribacteria bacterium]|jgi:hypothetical protein|nr:MAG: hypothetical protein XD79_0079 [Atribacteria bacterium 34_128]HAJ33079.1 hypothetical protein [Candidatus Atribacteria bacterium]
MIFPQTNKIEYKERKYRNLIEGKDLIPFQVKEAESDLYIRANQELSFYTRQMLLNFRGQIENYIDSHPLFKSTLLPYSQDKKAPEIIKSMIHTTALCGVGPMAAVAGAIAEFVGEELLNYSSEVIIENGGDIFIKSNKVRKVSIFAGSSPFSQRIILKIEAKENYIGICTSSGMVGPSLSFGKADAVTVISDSVLIADAAATAIGNIIKTKEDIDKGLIYAQKIKRVKGVVIIKDDKMGLWGDINFTVVK